MLKGRYGDTSGRPFIAGHISIPAIKVDGPVSLLIDTGADCTVLMPSDGARLGVDYSKLKKTDDSLGFGGISRDYIIPAIVIVAEHEVVAHAWQIEIRIAAPKPELMSIPSVIGRDILNHWCITFDPTSKILHAEVRFSDAQTILTD